MACYWDMRQLHPKQQHQERGPRNASNENIRSTIDRKMKHKGAKGLSQLGQSGRV